jgi:ABC-2 type transport system permease protein
MKAALAHASWELRLTLRNGEQLLLTMIIPLVLLIAMCVTTFVPVYGNLSRVASAYPVVCTVSVIATCFTSLAIGTGFERRSGALTFLATTPLGRQGVVLGKILATVLIAAISISVVTVAAVALGWRAQSASAWCIPILILGGVAFASWALFVASVFRAEAVLAIANAAFLLLILLGGVIVSSASMPMGGVIAVLPSAALARALRDCLGTGIAPAWSAFAILGAWAIVGFLLARSRFRWQ